MTITQVHFCFTFPFLGRGSPCCYIIHLAVIPDTDSLLLVATSSLVVPSVFVQHIYPYATENQGSSNLGGRRMVWLDPRRNVYNEKFKAVNFGSSRMEHLAETGHFPYYSNQAQTTLSIMPKRRVERVAAHKALD